MSLREVIGHQRPISLLQRAVHTDRLPSGYLFVGPPNVGKTLAAVQLAKAINCQSRLQAESAEEVDCCDECEACRLIERGHYPYVRVVFPMLKAQQELYDKQVKKLQEQKPQQEHASEAEEQPVVFDLFEVAGAEVLIGPVKDMLLNANLKAPKGIWKVYIVLSVEKVRDEAANSLLKTLEEPPPRTTFILTTSRPADVLSTIVSRCQVINFGPVPAPQARASLLAEFPDIAPDAVRATVASSAGRYGWAHRMLAHPRMLEHRQVLLALLVDMPNYQLFEGMRIGEQLVELAERWFLDSHESGAAAALLKTNRDQILRTIMIQLLDVQLTWWRDIMLLASVPNSDGLINVDHAVRLRELAALYDDSACRRAGRWIQEARDHLQGNANLRLSAELLMLKLISLSPSHL